MKVNIGADTSDFEKGAKEVKKGLKDLSKTGEDALGALGSAFGVNTGKIGEMTSAIRGAGQRMTECGNVGVKAFGDLLKGITPLQAGIAGLGLAAAVAGFNQLKSAAENFKSTIDGMNMAMATSAYISPYKQVLYDVNSETGKQVAEAMDKWQRGFGKFKAQLGATFVTAVGQDQKWYDAFLPTGVIRAWNTVKAASEDAEAAATRNAERADQIADIRKQELQVRRDIADIDVEIAEQRRIIRDRSKSAEERSAAEAAVRDKIAQKAEMQKGMAQQLYELQSAMTGEAGSTYEQMREVTDLYVEWKNISVQETDQMATIDRYSNSIAGNTSAAAKAAKEYADQLKKMGEVKSKWSGMGTVSTAGLGNVSGGVTGPSMSILPQRQDIEAFKETFHAYLGDMDIHVGIKADTEKIQDVSNEINSLLSSSISKSAELIGSLVGTLAGGGDAWGDFKNVALSAFGDMAIAVGKIAIAAGLASEGIQAALHMDNPYIAIAAGAALIALGSAVKSSLSAVASGDYSAAGGGYSGGGYSSSGSNGYETREVNVNVNGTLVANGDQLVAVIQNTNKKNYYLGGE